MSPAGSDDDRNDDAIDSEDSDQPTKKLDPSRFKFGKDPTKKELGHSGTTRRRKPGQKDVKEKKARKWNDKRPKRPEM